MEHLREEEATVIIVIVEVNVGLIQTKRPNIHSPEETGMFHIICIFIVCLLRTNPHPEKVLWLLPLINYLVMNE